VESLKDAKYGDTADLMACCLLSMVLALKINRRLVIRASAGISLISVFSGFYAVGWSVFIRAFLWSLSTINQTIGGVLFAAAVLVAAGIAEWRKYPKSQFMRWLLQFLGATVLAAISIWLLIFIFHVFIRVPFSIYRHARRISIPILNLPSPHPPDDWNRQLLARRSSVTPITPPIIRIGSNCPEKYKLVPTLQIAQWTMDEADTIGVMSAHYLDKYRNLAYRAQSFLFTVDYKNCCLQAVIELRAETICRLPPAAISSEESFQFTQMMEGPSLSDHEHLIGPYGVSYYSAYLRKLGVELLD